MIDVNLINDCSINVHPQTIEAIIKVESHYKPYAINVNKKGYKNPTPKTKKEALKIATNLLNDGYSIDIGLGQINSTSFKKMGYSVADMLDSCKNINAISAIISENYKRALKVYPKDKEKALLASLSAYNTGDFKSGFKNGYVDKYKNLLAFNKPPQRKPIKKINKQYWNIYSDQFSFQKSFNVFNQR